MRMLRTALKQTFAQISRNKPMSLASFASIMAILLVLGVLFIVVVNVNNLGEGVKGGFDEVQVYLYDEADKTTINSLRGEIEKLSGVTATRYLSREDALEQWKEKWGENADLLDRLETNPLPNSIVISIADVAKASAIVEAVTPMNGVEKVNYSQDTIDRLLRITRAVQNVSLAIIVFLIFVSIMIVSNTIKLTVVARQKEIAIMRYIGATNWFIRAPFLLEGVLIGAASAIASAAIVAGLYHVFIDKWGRDVLLLLSNSLVDEVFLAENLIIIFAAIGVSVGSCGSIISMRRFLAK